MRTGAFPLVAAGFCEIGLVRERNEDFILVRPDLGLFAAADGMGGHAGGDVASRAALEVLEQGASRNFESPSPSREGLADLARSAHQRLRAESESNPRLEGMGTTLTALQFGLGKVFLAHVGDSRAYRLRGSGLVQLSLDHSLIAEKIRIGLLTAEEGQASPYRNILTRALGTQQEVDLDFAEFDVREGDRYLICTDGLWSHVEDPVLKVLLQSDEPIDRICARLVQYALDEGGRDNISVVLIDVRSGERDGEG